MIGGPSEDLQQLIGLADWITAVEVDATPLQRGNSVLVEQPSLIPGARDGERLAPPFLMGRNSRLLANAVAPRTIIGRYTTISRRVEIGAPPHQLTGLSTGYLSGGIDERSEEAEIAVTIIGCDVWVGMSAFIRNGVVIGHGAVVQPGAVVTRDVPPYAVVSGNPARVQRSRFPAGIAERLLATRWWALPPDVVAGLPRTDVEACLTELERQSA